MRSMLLENREYLTQILDVFLHSCDVCSLQREMSGFEAHVRLQNDEVLRKKVKKMKT